MAKHDSYKKWEWALLGGLVGAAIVVAAEVTMVSNTVAKVEKHMVIKRSSADGYTLIIAYLPARRFRSQQMVIIEVTNNGQYVSNTSVDVTISQGGAQQNMTYQTDSAGAILLDVTTEQTQTMTVTASFTAPNGEALYDRASLAFPAAKGAG